MNQNQENSVRIDKWLWAVRLFKTRSLATEACRKGLVKVDGHTVKASREIKLNDVITAEVNDVVRTIKVLGLISNRVGAVLVSTHAQELTDPAEFQKQRERNLSLPVFRPKGLGRPTKKDRRTMEKMVRSISPGG